MDLQWIPDAYEAANRGDWSEFAARVAPDYRHHIPSLDIEWVGADKAVEGLRERYASTGLSQSAVDATEHGPYVIVSVTGNSDLRAGTFSAVHVFRADGDRFVECWALHPPMG